MATIRFDQVTKRFGKSVVAVDQLDLTVGDREFLVLLGPSGCGKTTALRMLAGLEEVTEGTIWLNDRDITDVQPKDRDLAMVFQSYALYPHMTVEENISFSLRLRKTPKDEIKRRVGDAARMLQLDGLLGRRPKELSGGQRQRVALGRAIVRNPAAFLMDEPLSNLDAKLRTGTRAEISRLHQQLQATFIYVTHDQVEAMTMATRIAVMNLGVLQQVGTPEEVYDRPANTFVAQFIGTPPMNLVPADLEGAGGDLRAVGPTVTVPLGAGSETGPRGRYVGVRPEQLRPVAETADVAGSPEFRGTVTALEMLGNEVIALVEIAGVHCAVRGPRDLGVERGEAVRLTCHPAAIHLFDRETGRRLVRQSAVPAGFRDAHPVAVGAA